MPVEKLDFYFPWVVFFYGFLLILVLENDFIMEKVGRLQPQLIQRLAPRRQWAWICLFVGGFWTLQNAWF